MIGFLKGVLVTKKPPQLVLEVAGVGYELEAPMSTFDRLPDTGEQFTLITHELVRDDAHLLYGFSTEAERALFRSLLKVSGVGARIALGILSGIAVEGFRQCVLNKDVTSLTRVPGIGRKTAERLLVEMADRLPRDVSTAADGDETRLNAAGEAHGALLKLGYRPGEAIKMLQGVGTPQATAEDLIREALKRVHSR
ncbi:MAG: Holliday junction branch migration protein RuvA [Gammaproteobacteria bacterium]